MGDEEFLVFVNKLDWTFAKTCADICPHEYIIKNKLDPVCQVKFEEAVSFIRKAGFKASYKDHPGKYYILDGHYYWTMGEPIEQTTIINRAKLIDYTLIENNWVWKGNRFQAKCNNERPDPSAFPADPCAPADFGVS